MGEFGRLAVHPDGRRRGIGKMLMEERLARTQDRLQIAIVENRASHPFSQRISAAYGMVPVGLLPKKLIFGERESIALYARFFGDALSLRRNHPRIIPEAYPLAELVLRDCGLPCDAIADDEAAPYPREDEFQLDTLKAEGYSSLFRLERGRVAHREVFGPARLSVGWFKMRASHSTYLVAREDGAAVGALGFTRHEEEGTVNVFEIISADERPIRSLVEEFVRLCDEEFHAEYVEVDVSAHAPRMQRTLLEAGFLPVGYIPAMVFDKVERLDCVKMARVRCDFTLAEMELCEAGVPVARAVARNFERRAVAPRVAEAIPNIGLFKGLNEEQTLRLAATFRVERFAEGERVFREGESDHHTIVVLSGEVSLEAGEPPSRVATARPGECAGELSLVKGGAHSLTAVARGEIETAVMDHGEFEALVRMRPDIGVIVNRNLAVGLGDKLRRGPGSKGE